MPCKRGGERKKKKTTTKKRHINLHERHSKNIHPASYQIDVPPEGYGIEKRDFLIDIELIKQQEAIYEIWAVIFDALTPTHINHRIYKKHRWI